MFFFSLFFACGDKITNQDTAILKDSAEEIVEDTAPPTAPAPFTITLSGAETESLYFDTPTCQIPDAAPNLNVFWRASTGAHVFVLRIMLRNDFQGTGDYDNQNHMLTVTLQEEAGGESRYYQVDGTQGDMATLQIETAQELINGPLTVWGDLDISTMHNSDAQITISPTTIPIWCDAENTN